jgi:hypothetical protein
MSPVAPPVLRPASIAPRTAPRPIAAAIRTPRIPADTAVSLTASTIDTDVLIARSTIDSEGWFRAAFAGFRRERLLAMALLPHRENGKADASEAARRRRDNAARIPTCCG